MQNYAELIEIDPIVVQRMKSILADFNMLKDSILLLINARM